MEKRYSEWTDYDHGKVEGLICGSYGYGSDFDHYRPDQPGPYRDGYDDGFREAMASFGGGEANTPQHDDGHTEENDQ